MLLGNCCSVLPPKSYTKSYTVLNMNADYLPILQAMDNMNNEPNGQNFEPLLRELRELKEEIKNQKQITSSDIAEGIFRGIMKVIGILFLIYIALYFITFLFYAGMKFESNSPTPTITATPESPTP